MSMTQEEAIEVLENGGWWDSLIPVTTIEGRIEDDKLHEAIDLAIAALRPVSREQVKKVWRGEWNNVNPAVLKPGVSWVCRCAKCGCPQDYKHNFCPSCGDAQTDEAVDMILERMEALKDGL